MVVLTKCGCKEDQAGNTIRFIINSNIYPSWLPNLWRIIIICKMTDSPSKQTNTICRESRKKISHLLLSHVEDGGERISDFLWSHLLLEYPCRIHLISTVISMLHACKISFVACSRSQDNLRMITTMIPEHRSNLM